MILPPVHGATQFDPWHHLAQSSDRGAAPPGVQSWHSSHPGECHAHELGPQAGQSEHPSIQFSPQARETDFPCYGTSCSEPEKDQ